MPSLTAFVRRLNKSGSPLYIRLSRADLSRLDLNHGDAVQLDLDGLMVRGVVKTSGGSPWLAPMPDEKGDISQALVDAGLTHGRDVEAAVTIVPESREAGVPRNVAELPPVVLVENELTAGGQYDHWQDSTGERYQFPNSYKGKILPGRRFVYYRGARRADGLRGVPEYFGHGVVDVVHLDPGTDENDPKRLWKWICDIEVYEPFDTPVLFKNGDIYIEQIPKNLWGVVREIPEDIYAEILRRANAPSLKPPLMTGEQDIAPTLAGAGLLAVVKRRGRDVRPADGSGYGRHRSRESKAVGDQGERAVLKWLRQNLDPEEAQTVVHDAVEGRTPGYDISYRSGGEVIAVEVKATRGTSFPSVEITANEWRAAQELRGRYRLALVARAMTPTPVVHFIDDLAGKIDLGMIGIEASVHRVMMLG
jgi:hypothetical protein